MDKEEIQNIEFKSSWRDEWLKWICGFANANGGVMWIGKNDNGKPVGIVNKSRLLEDLPNKIKNYLAILSNVEYFEEDGKDLIKITTKKYEVAISFKGKYYLSIGTTNHELNGVELQNFLLGKSGKTWDDIIDENSNNDDIDINELKNFISTAQKSNRIPELHNKNISTILDKLNLVDGNNLRRAAILLFGKNPQNIYPNAIIKIGKFESEGIFSTQDEVKGNLINQAREAFDTLQKKYLSLVSFEGIRRIDGSPIPEKALREALLNAIVHKDYSGSTIQIKVYENKLAIWNEGELPSGLDLESLKVDHPSKPRNPKIADIFVKAGLIES